MQYVKFKNICNVRVASYVFWETVPQIMLRNCSKEARGKGQYICDFSEGRKHASKHTFSQKVSTGLVSLA